MTGSRRRVQVAIPPLIDRLQNTPLYPTLISVAFVIEVWRHTSLDAQLLIRPIGFAIPVAVAVTALGAYVARNQHIGGVVAGIVALGVLGGDDLRVPGLAGIALLAVALLVRRAPKFRRPVPWPELTRLANLIALIMLGTIGFNAFVVSSVAPLHIANSTTSSSSGGGIPQRPPDILIVLLDAHARQDLLAEFYGEDLSPFVNSLEARGFDVSARSRSNYMTTQLTLASMFNFTHVPDLELPAFDDPAFSPTLRAHLDHNRLFSELRGAGYRIETVSSGFDGLSLRSSDVLLDGGQINELEVTLLVNTAFKQALNLAAPNLIADQARARVRWNLSPSNWLHDFQSGRGPSSPVFLFVHVPSPHQPIVFARDGTPNQRTEFTFVDATPFTERTPAQLSGLTRAYADQLAYIDTQAIAAIDQILLSAASNTVVIVMSDHGPGVHIDWSHLTTTDTRERFGILFAARTPGSPNLFGAAPTPVNLFPTLLNHYLGLNLPLQSDSSFLGAPPRHELIEIGNPDR